MTESAHDLLWGAEAIGRVINRTPRQTFHLLENNLLPFAKKVGGKWACSRRALLDHFGTASADEAAEASRVA